MPHRNTTTVAVQVIKVTERSNGCSGKTLLAPFARKKRLQENMTKEDYWIGAEENTGMFNKSLNDRYSFFYLSLFERQGKAYAQ